MEQDTNKSESALLAELDNSKNKENYDLKTPKSPEHSARTDTPNSEIGRPRIRSESEIRTRNQSQTQSDSQSDDGKSDIEEDTHDHTLGEHDIRSRKHENGVVADIEHITTKTNDLSDAEESDSTQDSYSHSVGKLSRKTELSDVSETEHGNESFDPVSDSELSCQVKTKPRRSVPNAESLLMRETELDFEADIGDEQTKEETEKEAGECDDESVKQESDGEVEDADELEEGELSEDEGERKLSQEPKPVCRFFSKGQCTWGNNCRFLHPGVTDKGNYNMFDPPRPLVPVNAPTEFNRFPRPEVPPVVKEEPLFESAWERGLRHAKEMLKKSIQRKELDADFEEKKFNLTLGQEELDKENDYYTRSSSPILREAPNRDDVPAEPPVVVRSAPPLEYWGSSMHYQPQQNYYPRVYHMNDNRRGDFGGNRLQKQDRMKILRDRGDREMVRDIFEKKKKAKIVFEENSRHKEERHPPANADSKTRADDWADPWMRSKSPTSRKSRTDAPARRASYSTRSSYSSSSRSSYSTGSSSRSSSYSSYSSRSRSPGDTKGKQKKKTQPSTTTTPSTIRPAVPTKPTPALKSAPPSKPVEKAPSTAAAKRPPVVKQPIAPVQSPTKSNVKPTIERKPVIETTKESGGGGGIKRVPPEIVRKIAIDMARRVAETNPPKTSRTRSVSSSSSHSRTSSSSSSSSRSSSRSSGSHTSKRELSPASKTKVAMMVMNLSERRKIQQLNLAKTKAMDALKLSGQKQQIKLTLKAPGTVQANKKVLEKLSDDREADKAIEKEKEKAVSAYRKRPAPSPPLDEMPTKITPAMKAALKKHPSSRREELLKQLKAVEDAIARKRSKF